MEICDVDMHTGRVRRICGDDLSVLRWNIENEAAAAAALAARFMRGLWTIDTPPKHVEAPQDDPEAVKRAPWWAARMARRRS